MIAAITDVAAHANTFFFIILFSFSLRLAHFSGFPVTVVTTFCSRPIFCGSYDFQRGSNAACASEPEGGLRMRFSMWDKQKNPPQISLRR
jgi:hypothetical protein